VQSPVVRLLDGIQSALNPQGPDAALIAEMSWVLFAGAAAIFAGVMALALYAVFARRENASRLSPRTLVVGGGIAFTTVTLFALLLYSLARASTLHPAEDNALRIEVIGEQWWWRVRYPDFETANEIRVPIGRPVELVLRSADVVHSFWVPVLAGKLDMIPGRANVLRVRADRPGRFRGQCAEYCGGQHALMALLVVATPETDFQRWLANEALPVRDSRDPEFVAGHNLFFRGGCAECHTIRGTDAVGDVGPDLTHVGSRRSLAAGILDNHVGTMAGWIAGPQDLKPGSAMPDDSTFTGPELRALASWLERLE
jgi:cytochrome c oxidase subunit 2